MRYLLVFLTFFAGTLHAQERSADLMLLDELLSRGLYRLAEVHCEKRLAEENLAPELQAEMTVEMLRVLGERSLVVTGTEKDECNERLKSFYENYSKARPESVWMPVVDFQYALGVFAQARQLALEGSSQGFDSPKMEEARAALRTTIRLLRDLEETLLDPTQSFETQPKPAVTKSRKTSDSTPAPAPGRFSPQGLSVWEIVSLQDNIQYNLLLALKAQGETYPPGSMDRLNSLTQAREIAGNLYGLGENSPIRWDVRLAEIQCLRLLGTPADLQAARRRVESLELQTLPPQITLSLQAEKIRLWILGEELDRALTFVGAEFQEEIVGQNGELDSALLELHLALWQRAETQKNEAETKKWNDSTLALLERIRRVSSPWWVRKSEVLFAQLLGKSGDSDNLELLVLAADNAIHSLPPEEALASCEKAWSRAVELKDAENAVRIATLAGSYCHAQNDLRKSFEWFRRLAVEFPEHPDAVKNHNLALGLLGVLVRNALETAQFAETSEELDQTLDVYESVLIEHFRLFETRDPQALDILRRLEKLTRLRRQPEKTVDISMVLVAKIPTSSEDYAPAVDSAFQAWNEYLKQFSDRETDDFRLRVRQAIRWSTLIETTPEQRLSAVRWRLDFCPELAPDAEKLLREILKESELPDETRLEAQCFLVLALVTQGQDTEIGPMLAQVSASGGARHAETLQTILRKLHELGQLSKSVPVQKKYAGLELEVFSALEPTLDTLPEADRDALETIASRALLTLGRVEEAFTYYERLARKFPNRRDIQTAWGRLLTDEGIARKDEKLLRRALEQWRGIEKRTENQTSEWFEAKYEVARLYFELGETSNAARLVRTLTTLYPDLGGPATQKNFQELQKKLIH